MSDPVFDKKYDSEFNRVWRKKYTERCEQIKGVDINFTPHTRMAELKIKGHPDIIKQLVATEHRQGDMIHVVISNMNIKSMSMSFNGRVEEYPRDKTRSLREWMPVGVDDKDE